MFGSSHERERTRNRVDGRLVTQLDFGQAVTISPFAVLLQTRKLKKKKSALMELRGDRSYVSVSQGTG